MPKTLSVRGLTARELGHVSLFVRDLDATRRFYSGVLGLTETGTGKNGRIVFFSAGRHHHDVSCELARADGPGPQPKGVPGRSEERRVGKEGGAQSAPRRS